jgi:hypothetical protein
MMKKLIFIFFAVWATPGFAALPLSAFTSMVMPVYGIYTSADPTCLTGLVATVPLKVTPTDVDFVAAGAMGTGSIPTGGINCVIIVTKLKMTVKYAAGTYTSTSTFGSSTFNDSNCNAGGTVLIDNSTSTSTPFGCNPGKRATKIDWPAKITTDLTALGLTPATDCQTLGSGAILPFYLSTYSKCVGNSTVDNTIGGTCSWSNNVDINPGEGYRSNIFFQAPTATADAIHGLKINAVAAGSSSLKFVVDPTPVVGGNGGSSCGGLNPPTFSFTTK